MNIAVLADLHANQAAMAAIDRQLAEWNPDHVLLLGDIINRGPRPLECLEWVLDGMVNKDWLVIRGNHEDYVLSATPEHEPQSSWQRQVLKHTYWTRRKVEPLLDIVAAWPEYIDLPLPYNRHLKAAHASMLGNRKGIYSHMNEDEMARHMQSAPDVFTMGHTHVPFIRQINHTVMFNSGSCGLPFDRDPRICITLLHCDKDGCTPVLHRLPYDISQAEKDFFDTGYYEEGGPFVQLIHRELLSSSPCLGIWHRDYEAYVAAGRLTLEESVEQLLAVKKQAV